MPDILFGGSSDVPGICGCAFHSWANLDEAVEEMASMRMCSVGLAVYKAVIPADSAFVYEGTNRFGGPTAYASQKLKIVEKVSDYHVSYKRKAHIPW